jgi:hypothetical protein
MRPVTYIATQVVGSALLILLTLTIAGLQGQR